MSRVGNEGRVESGMKAGLVELVMEVVFSQVYEGCMFLLEVEAL
jgi:hypothetical protein